MCAKKRSCCNVCIAICGLVAGYCWWNIMLIKAIPGCHIPCPMRPGVGLPVAMVSHRRNCWRRCPAVFCARCTLLQAWLVEHCNNLANCFDMPLNFVAVFGVGGQFEVGRQVVQGARIAFQLEIEDAT